MRRADRRVLSYPQSRTFAELIDCEEDRVLEHAVRGVTECVAAILLDVDTGAIGRWVRGTGEMLRVRFLWSLPLEDSIRLVEGAAGRYTRLLAKGDDSHSGDSDQWSTTGYVWHVVDIIRFGTERLWTLALDAAAGIPGWDHDDMAAVRRYEKPSR